MRCGGEGCYLTLSFLTFCISVSAATPVAFVSAAAVLAAYNTRVQVIWCVRFCWCALPPRCAPRCPRPRLGRLGRHYYPALRAGRRPWSQCQSRTASSRSQGAARSPFLFLINQRKTRHERLLPIERNFGQAASLRPNSVPISPVRGVSYRVSCSPGSAPGEPSRA